MAIEEAVYSRTYTGGSALIGTRCYPQRLPEGVTLPAMTYQRISTNSMTYQTHDTGVAGYAMSRFQLSCYASTVAGVKALAEQVRQTWDGYRGTVEGVRIDAAMVANRLAGRADAVDMERETVDVLIWHAE